MSAEELAGVQTPCAHHVRTSYGVDEAPREIVIRCISYANALNARSLRKII